MASSSRSLGLEWFIRLDRLRAACYQLPPTGLDCLGRCSARCCPRVQMRGMAPEDIASPAVVLLPFEMEYLIGKNRLRPEVFRRWPVEIKPGVTIQVGMFDLGRPCPFLKPELSCGIYRDRPVDCQTFPLLPYLDGAGQLAWTYALQCPSLALLNPALDHAVRDLWAELYTVLPRAWWDLYALADHWLGWPEGAADA